MKKILFLSFLLLSLNVLAQNITFDRWLTEIDLLIKKTPKLAQAASVNFDVGTYGLCSNVGTVVAAGSAKGQEYKQETLYMAANFIQLASTFRKQAIVNGVPAAAFDSSLQATRSVGYSQVDWDTGFQKCAGILNNILKAAK